MIKFSIKRCLVYAVVLLAITIVSCNKTLEVNSSRLAKDAGHWNSFDDARSGLFGIYGLLRAALAENNNHWAWGELRNGDFAAVNRPDLKAIINGEINASYDLIESARNWRRFYAVVNAANLFIERADSCLVDPRYNETYYRLDIAQARALRAFTYFYMVRIWGDVPLIISSHEGGNFEEIAKRDKNQVLDFAEGELRAVAGLLPYLYSGSDPEQLFPASYYGLGQDGWANTAFNRLAAYATLAHISAWRGRYSDCYTYANFVLGNFRISAPNQSGVTPIATLVARDGLFYARSGNYRPLISFEFEFPNGESTIDGHIESWTLANTEDFPMFKKLPDIYIPKNKIAEIFPSTSPNDQRFGVDALRPDSKPYTNYFENFSAEIPVFKKIRVINSGGGSRNQYLIYNSSIVFTRYEELRLLHAEAAAVLGLTIEALSSLNEVRNNRGAKTIDSPDKITVIQEIFEERRRELMGEGWRWYDQVRAAKLLKNNPELIKLIETEGIYWPVSQAALTFNSKITQNPHWQ